MTTLHQAISPKNKPKKYCQKQQWVDVLGEQHSYKVLNKENKMWMVSGDFGFKSIAKMNGTLLGQRMLVTRKILIVSYSGTILNNEDVFYA